ncbi:hypothetical protein OH77DRAFT_506346 [Trametes cingulata]|nr:hypothetical protein OH77DRAFT_506346 [Trametes cingulata]
MTSPHSFSFSKPAMPGDAVSVLVLVEDSGPMAAKWPEVRDSYLPVLLENLRAADPSVLMEARWLTTSASSPVATSIGDAADCRNVPDLILGQGTSSKISPAAIHNAINILAMASRALGNATRHFILVAATGPSTSSPMSDATPSGFDPWDDIALVLAQQYIRLHVILNIGAEMRTYHELFKRSLHRQSNLEVPAWFLVDPPKFSIRLSGRPQYVRSSVAVSDPLIPTGIPPGHYGNPSPPPLSTKSASPTTPPTQGSPPPASSPPHRKSSTSPVTPRSRGGRGSETSNSPPEGGGGLVSYLQQMHGLTKKKSYGVKAPKKTYADIQLPMAGRPILPRLEVPQSTIYTYPSFDNGHGAEQHVLVSDTQPPPSRRHSADQLPPSLVARTTNEDRRARRRGPWLPIAPLVSSTPSSPTSVTSPGTLAALQSLASMTPRLPDFVTKGRAPPVTGGLGPTEAQDPYAAHSTGPADAHAYAAHPGMTSRPADAHAPYPASPPQDPQAAASPTYYYPRAPAAAPQWSQQGSVGASPASPVSAPSPSHTSTSGFSDASRQYSDYTYGSSPPSSAAATPLSMTAPAGAAENAEDQPFIITPEIVAKSDADMEEVVRSGALQASMTPALCSVVQTMQPALSSPMYVPSEPMSPDQLYYPAAMPPPHGHPGPVQDAPAGYHVYPSEVHMSAEHGVPQADASWQYGAPQGYMPPIPDYVPPQGHWYPT